MKFLLAIGCAFIVVASSAQFRSVEPRGRNSGDSGAASRVWYGAGAGFSAGTYPNLGVQYLYFSVTPVVGYKVTPAFSLGAIGTYQTYRFSAGSYPAINQYGAGPFAEYRFGPLGGWAEMMFVDAPNSAQSMQLGRAIYRRFPIGIGYTSTGQRAAIKVLALYDVIYNRTTTVFASPFIFRVIITGGAIHD